ncbi:DNA repair protein complementing XP-A cells-like protein [Armadillidium vulgare]|nr:DNA repair protein complementing XP-A cells-like protein [Armadillidium vulgare]
MGKVSKKQKSTHRKDDLKGNGKAEEILPEEHDTVNVNEETTITETEVCEESEHTISKPLTMEQKALIEVNRQKALLIRMEKLNKRKFYDRSDEKKEPVAKVIRINDSKLVDTGGGFFIEEKENELTEEDVKAAMDIVTDPPPLFKDDQPFCNECSQPFDNSYLSHNFDEPVCDDCRERDDKHSLITKTDAKLNYLLKDSDFDKRDPALKFILKKNPHNSQWGDMKLYLKLQVERRALEVWGSEEVLEEAIEKQEGKRQITKQKRYMKKMKELRMNVRSSLYTRATKSHEHEYGEEVYHPDEDEYSKTCKTCDYSYRYDKM